MQNKQIITKIRGIFHKNLKNNDSRCNVQPVNFIAALVCSFATCDGRKKSMSAMPPDGHPKCPTCGHLKMPHLTA